MMKLTNSRKKTPYKNLLPNSTLINKFKKFTTSPYKKPTSDNSTLLNYSSDYTQKYKTANIKDLIDRAFYISSSKTIFYKELTNIKQTLVNNNFSNKLVDQQIKLYLQNINKNNNTTNRINLYYRNQMHYNSKLDKQAITNIIEKQNLSSTTTLNLKHETLSLRIKPTPLKYT